MADNITFPPKQEGSPWYSPKTWGNAVGRGAQALGNDFVDALSGARHSRTNYTRTKTSYSGADITATAQITGEQIPGELGSGSSSYKFGELSTISYSIHRDKLPVRCLGRTYAKSFVRGPRTIAGTMIFTVLDKNVFTHLWSLHSNDQEKMQTGYRSGLADQLKPFDLNILFVNEHPYHLAKITIYGVELIDESQTMSIHDIMTENTYSYVARDIDLMIGTDYSNLKLLDKAADSPYTNSDMMQSFYSNVAPVSQGSHVNAESDALPRNGGVRYSGSTEI